MAAEALAARDRIGVQDFVLLEDFKSVDAFTDNLQKRFHEKLIYVSPPMMFSPGLHCLSFLFVHFVFCGRKRFCRLSHCVVLSPEVKR